MKKKIALVLLVAATAGIVVGVYLYNKPVPSLENEQAAYTLSAGSLYAAFEADENASNAKYLGQVLEVTGVVQSTSSDEHGVMTVNLETGNLSQVSCQMASGERALASLAPNQKVTVKGVCSGMLMDVVLVNCIPLN